ncbi:MAG: class I SAM-dependent methyltransferase [Dechloromonas sp.]|nr:MAG: class I SAM-dependent methyltransferase [Dechloromonas sp.]
MSVTPLRQLALQGAAVILVLSLAWPYFGWQAEAMPWLETSVAIGGVAFLFATLSRQPWWWRLIHAGFMPLVWATHRLAIDPGWFLLAFLLLLLVYRGALSGQIPLYLSNRQTVAALDRLLEREDPGQVVDLGAGLGSTLIPLADAWPERYFTGIENAPATWLASRLLGVGRPNLQLRWGDLWSTPLGDADVVYAFLSPAPMSRLWAKAQAEMKPGSLFVSNSFPVPGVTAGEVIDVDCTPPRPLYCYRM